ncbi:MAG TPA: NAD(P)-dependent oxidoreductase [Candidatus Nanoarchaeia archaeon]|nr:NAD(P)-dependent oxidoreductase [Candidatus Nanoarchaeia archaeon]
MKHKISFIGAGTMGQGMIKNLAAHGFDVEFFNRTKKEISGAKYVSLDELSGDVVFICVSNDDALKEMFLGLELRKGQIIVDCGTTSLKRTSWISNECERDNVDFLDAPITGSKLGAENGKLLFMAGGDKKTFDSLQEEFNAMGKMSVYCGENGMGQRAKHALNLTQSNILQGYLEGLILAGKLGVSLDAMQQIMENSAAQNGVGSFKLPYIKRRDFNAHFQLWLMSKDLKLAEEEIKELGLDLPLSRMAIEIFDEAMREGLGKEDFCSIVKLLEKKNKIKIV